MASSADELESEDPDDELELDDDPEPPSRVEDCSVVISPDQRSLIDSTSYHFSARTTLRHQRGGYGEQDRESGTTDNQGGGRLVEPSAIKQPGPELQYANAHISQDREPAVVDRSYCMILLLFIRRYEDLLTTFFSCTIMLWWSYRRKSGSWKS